MQKITVALQKLKQEYREVVTLRYVDELEIGEIAAITGKGHIAISNIAQRFKKVKRNFVRTAGPRRCGGSNIKLMSKELIRQLKSLKHDSVKPDELWLKKNRELLLSQIKYCF